SESDAWGWTSVRLVGFGLAGIALVLVWVWHELRTKSPLIDLRVSRRRTVLTANVSGLLAGMGMYIVLSMIIRYVQTPSTESYGLGGSVVVAGLVLLPMSAGSFISSRLTTALGRWIPAVRILPLGLLVIAVSEAVFVAGRGSIWQICIIMGLLGLGMGSSFSVMPRMIVGVVPISETSSALSLNQVVRTVGSSIGSAMGASVLAAYTYAPDPLPRNHGYTVGAILGIGLSLLTVIVALLLPSRTRSVAAVSAEDEARFDHENADAATAGVIAYEPSIDRTPAAAGDLRT
ncbi:MAG: MFS transporter, partial [Actinobacteria bacterium]|nr:MFS transporter [Actinomycetota bacterium]